MNKIRNETNIRNLETILRDEFYISELVSSSFESMLKVCQASLRIEIR